MDNALLVTNMQEDFFNGGVCDRKFVSKINSLFEKFDLVIFVNECNESGLCLKHEGGSDLCKELDISKLKKFYIIKKSSNWLNSAFYDFDDVKLDTGLNKLLKENKIRELAICGQDHVNTINNTLLDALKKGFKINILSDEISHGHHLGETTFLNLVLNDTVKNSNIKITKTLD